jgi:hypothetical protein
MGRAGAVAVIALVAVASPALAEPCARPVDRGPLIAGPGATDFGQVAEACGDSDLFLRLRGEILVDRSDFYGVITAGSTLRGRYRLSDRWFFSASLDPATWRLPVNAVVSSSGVGFGPATLGAHATFAWQRTALAPYARLLLPIDTARHHGERWGAELGVSASRQVRARGSVRAGLTLPATLVAIGGTGHSLVLPGGLAEYAFTPRPWLVLAGGASARAQLAPSPSLSALALRLSAQVATRRGWHVALAGDVPVAGTDRTDATVTIFVGRGRRRQEGP